MIMIFISQILKKIKYRYQLHIKRDPFLLEVQRWFSDNGDQTLRLDYDLNKSSIVFDIGGYQGDFAHDIYEKFGCTVYIFEPVKDYYDACIRRFKGNPKVIPLNYGLSSTNSSLDIIVAENASSFFKPANASTPTEKVTLRDVNEVFIELGINHLDLLKINIEGGEFDVLPALIQGNNFEKIENVQIQFHNFVEHAAEERAKIRESMRATHAETWCYEFVWENWQRLKN